LYPFLAGDEGLNGIIPIYYLIGVCYNYFNLEVVISIDPLPTTPSLYAYYLSFSLLNLSLLSTSFSGYPN
jgi:hypothetical protein